MQFNLFGYNFNFGATSCSVFVRKQLRAEIAVSSLNWLFTKSQKIFLYSTLLFDPRQSANSMGGGLTDRS